MATINSIWALNSSGRHTSYKKKSKEENRICCSEYSSLLYCPLSPCKRYDCDTVVLFKKTSTAFLQWLFADRHTWKYLVPLLVFNSGAVHHQSLRYIWSLLRKILTQIPCELWPCARCASDWSRAVVLLKRSSLFRKRASRIINGTHQGAVMQSCPRKHHSALQRPTFVSRPKKSQERRIL